MMAKDRILLTGANGLLGGRLIRHLLAETDFDITAVAASEEKLAAMMEREGILLTERIKFFSNAQLLNGEADLAGVYGAVHLAFSRRMRPAAEIAASLDFTCAVFTRLAEAGVERIVNVSSQSVYGDEQGMRTEALPPAPGNVYSMAKYAAEVLLGLCMERGAVASWTNLRLDMVVQSQNLVKALCQSAKAGRLTLRGGKQLFSFVDADDAARAIAAMLQAPPEWEHVYNVGWNRKRYTLVEVAEMVADAAEQKGFGRPAIELDESEDIRFWAGMDTTRFMNRTGWRPAVDLTAMVGAMMEKTL